jgi:chemotaxis protein CheX
MMTRVELETFVEGTTSYFATAANQPASVGSPYIVQEGRPAVQEFTGMINIAGKRRGIVYFTASRPMLTVMLMRMGVNLIYAGKLVLQVGLGRQYYYR